VSWSIWGSSSGYDPCTGKLRVILYEYPFNERIRTYLRLEQLFERLFVLIDRTDGLDHHFAFITLFEILGVSARAELKTDILKDLERQRQIMSNFRGNPDIAADLLENLVDQLSICIDALNMAPNKLGRSLEENEWLKSLRSRTSIPGGTCNFDLPAYFAWQHHTAAQRRSDVCGLVEPLLPLSNAIKALLGLLRDSGSPQKIVAMGGQFQQNLPQGRTFQLLRLYLDPALNAIPEISANRLVASIRFVHQSVHDRVQANTADIAFELTLCA
jgi:cell division protein ZapD